MVVVVLLVAAAAAAAALSRPPTSLARRPAWDGWWFKACLFDRESGLRGTMLYLDLDTVRPSCCWFIPLLLSTFLIRQVITHLIRQVIVGSLAPLVASWRGGFATLSAAGFDAEEGITDG